MDAEDIAGRMSPDIRHLVDRVVTMYEAPFARFLGVEIESIEADRTVCTLDLRPDLMNSMGRGHGAAIYGLIDHTFAVACNLERDCTGQSSSVTYYRPAFGRLTATCVPINRSRSIEVHDVRVTSEEGKLVASSVCTAFVLRRD